MCEGMVKEIAGQRVVLMDKYLRRTMNPEAPRYPKTGDFIELKGYPLTIDGSYLVTMVEEFEPPVTRDADGRDIRISVFGEGGSRKGLSAPGLMPCIRASAGH